MIDIVIVEDDATIREAIKEYLNSNIDFSCINVFESVESFLAFLNKDNLPNVILMDIGLPGMSGISGIKLIKTKFPEINIIMLTVYHDTHKIFQSLCAGASGYLLKNSPFSDIKKAIEIVNVGGSTMSPQIARKVIEHFQTGEKINRNSGLTEKEKEIVSCLVDGLSYKMIATEENISIETVRSHIKNIYKKLHVHSKAEVIKKSLTGEI
jgi:DNA-binding NarL/FixJ family response regulator